MAQTDHLGRELSSGTKAQTVNDFAVEQGVLEAEDVKGTREEEEQRRKAHTEHAERVSRQMAPAPVRGERAEE